MEFKDLVSKLTGHTRHQPFRTNSAPIADSKVESYDSLSPEQRLRYAEGFGDRVIERYAEFSIGHIEFDDQGGYWDPQQLQTVRRHVEGIGKDHGAALIVMFVHGWNHNGHFDDENLRSLRAVLANLHDTEETLAPKFGWTPRPVIGIYPSWRGLTNRFPLVKRFSFWNRKRTAHKVGRGSLLEAMTWVEQMRFHSLDSARSRLVIVGHSFGGAATYSAVSHYIKTVSVEGEAESELASAPIKKVTGFGDIVVLVNPAFEAMIYDGINRLTREVLTYADNQHVVLLTVTADNDAATGKAFPFGQTLGRWREKRQPGEWAKIRTAVGHYGGYRTHVLEPRSDQSAKDNAPCDAAGTAIRSWTPLEAEPVSTDLRDYFPADRRWELSDEGELPQNLPFFMVQSRGKLIDAHNGIFTTLFMEFLRDFVIAQDLRQVALRSDERQT